MAHRVNEPPAHKETRELFAYALAPPPRISRQGGAHMSERENVAAFDADGCLDFIEARADQWADEINLVEMVKALAHVGRLNPRAPTEIREKFIARQEAMIDALIRQAFIEGFMAGDENRKNVERIKATPTPSQEGTK